MVELIPPKHCPDCGGTNINYVELWHRSQDMCKPSDPDWHPFEGISYDTWCEDCETCFDIFPNRHLGYYWYDAHPEDIPNGGNKRYTDILLSRNPPDERCGNCNHFFSGFTDVEESKYLRMEIYCDIDGKTDVKYYRPCIYDSSIWIKKVQRSKPSTRGVE